MVEPWFGLLLSGLVALFIKSGVCLFSKKNANSVRGYDVIDTIKAQVEASCSGSVSCSHIVALAARDNVNLVKQLTNHTSSTTAVIAAKQSFSMSIIFNLFDARGPTWTVQLGRRDALNASQSAANSNLPGPGSSLATLITMFGNKGLSPLDMTALSGARTVGQARCTTFRDRIYNDANINASFTALRQQTCPQSSGGDGTLAPIDVVTPDKFDNYYY